MPTVDEFEGFDCVLITGSKYDAHGDNPWILQLLDLLRGKEHHEPPRQLKAYFVVLLVSNEIFRTLAASTRSALQRRLLRPPNPLPPPRLKGPARTRRRLGTRPQQNLPHGSRPASLPSRGARGLSPPDAPGPSRGRADAGILKRAHRAGDSRRGLGE